MQRGAVAPTVVYVVVVGIGIVSLLGVVHLGMQYFLALWFMSVMSDVGAFFAGNFAGRHKLPDWLNKRKSWEGTSGQLVGALVAFVLVDAFVAPIPLYFVATAGAGSLLGDLANSYVKRRLGIKEWSNRLPGHGGYLDRFSSLSMAVLLTYLVMRLG